MDRSWWRCVCPSPEGVPVTCLVWPLTSKVSYTPALFRLGRDISPGQSLYPALPTTTTAASLHRCTPVANGNGILPDCVTEPITVILLRTVPLPLFSAIPALIASPYISIPPYRLPAHPPHHHPLSYSHPTIPSHCIHPSKERIPLPTFELAHFQDEPAQDGE